MWNLNEESNVNPWNANDYTDINEENEATHDDVGHPMDMFEKRIVQAEVFRGSERYYKFNEFAEENNIGEEDIINIHDESTAVESRLVLFYLK